MGKPVKTPTTTKTGTVQTTATIKHPGPKPKGVTY
jgi:hypothetical protein